MAKASEKQGASSWWGPLSVKEGRSARFRIGPLQLTITRLVNEWRICREVGANPHDQQLSLQRDCEPADEDEGAAITRHGVSHDNSDLLLSPIMPDRAVVSRPEHPVNVPPREAVSIYVGSPLWIRIAEPDLDRILEELPAVPPVWTWWGTNTMTGEQCYATRTYGRLRLDDASLYPHRVLTAVRVINASDEPLNIERLHLPVRNLAVYAAADGRLWTEAVTLERDAGEEYATLEVGHTPGDEADGATLIGERREALKENQLVRAFGRIFKF